jgi:hypothetical protein
MVNGPLKSGRLEDWALISPRTFPDIPHPFRYPPDHSFR